MSVQFRRADGSFVMLVNGLPYHVIESDPLFALHQMEAEEAPLEPEPAAPSIEEFRATLTLTFSQLLIGLVAEEWITEAEGEAWLIGTLPAAVLTLISGLPEGQRFAAKARASRPSVVLRLDPLVVALATIQEKTPEQLDNFFLTYANV
jgi:hypothetical protein